MIEQRTYSCPSCHAKIILRGGHTTDTMVVCNCGVWMDISCERDRTKLLNLDDIGVSGLRAIKNNPKEEEKKP